MRTLLLGLALLSGCWIEVVAPDTGVDPDPGTDTDGDADTDRDTDPDTADPCDADEVCNGIDDDCDGQVDDEDLDLVGAPTWYADADGDRYGDPATSVQACEAPPGHVGAADDCDDSRADRHPDHPELCDGADNDCDGPADEDAVDGHEYWIDDDTDGFGGQAALRACSEAPPAGTARNDLDCDDEDRDVHPDAPETCNSGDDDCDGLVDEDDPDLVALAVHYRDDDDDGFGVPGTGTAVCTATPPEGFASNGDDCDDLRDWVYPGADEVCDGVDNDCDGTSDLNDDDVVDAILWVYDGDGDGQGAAATGVVACLAPGAAWVTETGDCDDTDPTRFTGNARACDDVDHDCDGHVDFDADRDGFSDADCGGSDCDDTIATVRPDALGTCVHGASCADILDSGAGTTDGVYTVDPDGLDVGNPPLAVWCLQESFGGGWTHLGTRGDRWNLFNVETNNTFGDLGAADSKAPAWNAVPFTDVLFADGAGVWARYDNVGNGVDPWFTFQDRAERLQCLPSLDRWPMAAGTLTAGDFDGGHLCSTDLFLHAADHDGGDCKAHRPNEAHMWGPGWSAENNGGCDLDDPAGSSFVYPDNVPFGSDLALYVR